MTDFEDIRIEPTQPVRPAARVRPISRLRPVNVPKHNTEKDAANAAVTDGNLRAAYAQFVVDPDTHVTVIRIHDATTGQVLSESPSSEVQQMTLALKKYADTLARFKAAQHSGQSVGA
jgi:FlaG protein